jgi:DNA replication and repair protein RecF
VLPAINTQLCEKGARIIAYRHNLIGALNRVCPPIHSQLSGGKETLKLEYRTVSAVTDPGAGFSEVYRQLCGHMESHYGAEKASQSCLSGPHKDDLEVEICGLSARSFASQGQTRTAALALKFGLRELLREDCGEYPLLLLDDVLSELDEGRQQFICDNTLGGQTLITCCSEQSPLRRSGAALFKVADKTVTRCP